MNITNITASTISQNSQTQGLVEKKSTPKKISMPRLPIGDQSNNNSVIKDQPDNNDKYNPAAHIAKTNSAIQNAIYTKGPTSHILSKSLHEMGAENQVRHIPDLPIGGKLTGDVPIVKNINNRVMEAAYGSQKKGTLISMEI
jgi:hypothetical protein